MVSPLYCVTHSRLGLHGHFISKAPTRNLIPLVERSNHLPASKGPDADHDWQFLGILNPKP